MQLSRPQGKDQKNFIAKMLLNVGRLIDSLLGASEVEPVRQLSDEAREAWAKAWKRVQKIAKKRKKDDGGGGQSNAATCDLFIVLFTLVSLRLFDDDPTTVSSLGDVHECYERAVGRKDVESGEEPHWVRVLVRWILFYRQH
jgi:hypothetical protein